VHHRRFTLIEILTVIIIIMILMGIALGVTHLVGIKADTTKCESQIEAMKIALGQYYADVGYYPEQGTAGTVNQTWLEANIGNFIDFNGAPFSNNYHDPWGNDFNYESPGTMNGSKYDLWSMGQDGKHGDGGSAVTDAQTATANNSDDITNWKRN